MSLGVTVRAWKKSQQRGSGLLVLLALGDRSDDDGVCWPGFEELSSKARIDPRQTKRIIKHLESVGELYVSRGLGRGKSNLYFVTVGLDRPVIERTLAKRFKLEPLLAASTAILIEERRAAHLRASPIKAASLERVTSATPFSRSGKGVIPARESVTSEAERVTSSAGKGDILGSEMAASAAGGGLVVPIRHDSPHEPPGEPSHTARARSRFDLATCERYAATKPRLDNPDGYARAIYDGRRAGQDDEKIQAWLARSTTAPSFHQLKGKPRPELLVALLKWLGWRGVNAPSYARWFEPITQLTIEGDLVRIGVPDEVTRAWINGNYLDVIEDAFGEIGRPQQRFELVALASDADTSSNGAEPNPQIAASVQS